MSSAELNTETVKRYLELVAARRPDAIADLYATDATVEDPVGGEVHIGRQAILGFYTAALVTTAETDMVTLRALGHEAAFFWGLIIEAGGDAKVRIDIISTMTFDDEARITSMKAYWGPENISTLSR